MIRQLPKRLFMLTLLCAGVVGACGDDETGGNNAPAGSCNANGIVDPGEQCDGVALAGQTCLTLSMGRNDGTLACGADCKFVVSGCTVPPGGAGGAGFGGMGTGGI